MSDPRSYHYLEITWGDGKVQSVQYPTVIEQDEAFATYSGMARQQKGEDLPHGRLQGQLTITRLRTYTVSTTFTSDVSFTRTATEEALST